MIQNLQFCPAQGQPQIEDYVAKTLALDQSKLASLGRGKLAHSRNVQVVGPQSRPLPQGADPDQSLLQVGRDWMVSPELSHLFLAQRVSALMASRPSMHVTSTQPIVRPQDPFVASEPLFRIAGKAVYATTESLEDDVIARVVSLSEGYPPGLIAVHAGFPEEPNDAVWFAISAFDGETFIVWH